MNGMGKHTQGEWKIVHRGDGRIHDDIMAGEKRIASIGQSTIKNPDEAKANARLIAACPDMYSELRDRSNALGGVKILLLQGDIEGAMEILNRYELKFTDGPTMYSEALAKATVTE